MVRASVRECVRASVRAGAGPLKFPLLPYYSKGAREEIGAQEPARYGSRSAYFIYRRIEL